MQTTSNGVPYEDHIVSPKGAQFILFPNSDHSKKDVDCAKRELRIMRDVVSIRVASLEDRIDKYRSQVYTHPKCKNLKWFQINDDRKIMLNYLRSNRSPEEYVEKEVLPNIEATENRLFKEHRTNIYNF